MKKIIKLGLVLGIFACVSCVLLAVVNNFTAPEIERIENEKEQNALKSVLSGAAGYPKAGAEELKAVVDSCKAEIGSVKINKIFKAVDSTGNVIGYAANITGPTFETATILLGTDPEMKVTGVTILKTTDTPGKQKMADYKTSKVAAKKGMSFTEQFRDCTAEDFANGTNYETISGATLSSGGVANMIKAGIKVLEVYKASNK